MNNSSFLILVFLLSCSGTDNTRFGDIEVVSIYRETLNPIIAEISVIDVALRERAVGSADQATGKNFAKECLELDDQLAEVSILLDRMEAPSKLRELHSNIRQVVDLRREACKKIVEGWKVEESDSFSKADEFYTEAEKMLDKANQLLVSVNFVLVSVDEELAHYYSKKNLIS